MPKVSIITIFLNTEKFLEESVRSVLSQTYEDWELLLVDDGSSDGSTAIAQKYALQYPHKIIYLEHPGHKNGGMSATRNLGLRHAAGEYIALLDSDDVWLPHHLERQVEILDNNPQAAMAYGPTLFWHGWTGKPEDIKCDRSSILGVVTNKILKPPQLMAHFLRNGGCVPCTCAVTVRKDALLKTGGFEENFKSIYDDQVFYSKMALNYPIYIDENLSSKYRKHPDSACYKAERAGDYDSQGGPHKTESVFLQWLSGYIQQNGINDPDLNSALNKRISPYDFNSDNSPTNDITIAIKTFERPECLKDLLISIRHFYPQVRIIIADDSQKPYAPAIAAQFSNIECISLPFDVGISAGRNAILSRIKTKYFVLCDDDFIFYERTKLENFKRTLAETDIELIGGALMDKTDSGKFDKLHTYAGDFMMDPDRNLRIEFVNIDSGVIKCDIVLNFFMADTRAVLLKTGGWDPKFKITEHTIFFWTAKKAGLKVAFTPDVKVNHTGEKPSDYIYFRQTRKNKYFLMFFKELGIKSWTSAWGKVTPMDLKPKWYQFIFQQKCIPYFITQKFSKLKKTL